MMFFNKGFINSFVLGVLLICFALAIIALPASEGSPVLKNCSTGIPACKCMFLHNYDTREGVQHNVIYKVKCDKQDFTVFPNFTTLAQHGLPILEISLRGNRIEEIPAGLFSGLKVRSIRLEGNNLKRIHAEAFRGMKAFDIFSLNLEYNDLFSLPAGLFSPLMEHRSGLGLPMVRVNAANNPRLHLSDGVFSGVETQVDILDLSSTNLIRIPTQLLKPLTGLKELSLSYNNIQSIGRSEFPELPALEFLHLSDNIIEYIDREAFTNLRNLVSLSVTYNYLTSLSFLKGPCHFRKLRAVDTEGNPLVCDCDLFEIVRANTIQVFGECVKPSALQGSMLSYSVEEGDKPNYSVLEDLGRGLCGAQNASLRQWYDCDCKVFWPTFASYLRDKGSCFVDGPAKDPNSGSGSHTGTTDENQD